MKIIVLTDERCDVVVTDSPFNSISVIYSSQIQEQLSKSKISF